MMDHTYRGIPVSQMPMEAIYSCLNVGFEITENGNELPHVDNPEYWIRMRLEIELVRRSLGIPVRMD